MRRALPSLFISGKSTVIQLLERFYDPAQGTIHLAGRPLAEYNLGWLRERMGLISQEPVLFGDSIRYNGPCLYFLDCSRLSRTFTRVLFLSCSRVRSRR